MLNDKLMTTLQQHFIQISNIKVNKKLAHTAVLLIKLYIARKKNKKYLVSKQNKRKILSKQGYSFTFWK